MTSNHPDDGIRHLYGPTVDADGFLVGEIELPGGLPPDDDDHDDDHDDDQDDERDGRGSFVDSAWDEAMAIAERDGFVVFDPDTTGGFRALTPAEQAELTDTVHAGSPTFTPDTPVALDDQDAPNASPAGSAAQAEGFVERERPGVTDLDVNKALADSHLDQRDHVDLDALAQRLDDLRVRLSGYIWREGVDRDQALAERREQLGRWYDDDHAETESDADADTETPDGSFPGRGPCLIYPDDPRWYQ